MSNVKKIHVRDVLPPDPSRPKDPDPRDPEPFPGPNPSPPPTIMPEFQAQIKLPFGDFVNDAAKDSIKAQLLARMSGSIYQVLTDLRTTPDGFSQELRIGGWMSDYSSDPVTTAQRMAALKAINLTPGGNQAGLFLSKTLLSSLAIGRVRAIDPDIWGVSTKLTAPDVVDVIIQKKVSADPVIMAEITMHEKLTPDSPKISVSMEFYKPWWVPSSRLPDVDKGLAGTLIEELTTIQINDALKIAFSYKLFRVTAASLAFEMSWQFAF